jgi:hypothetical protein
MRERERDAKLATLITQIRWGRWVGFTHSQHTRIYRVSPHLKFGILHTAAADHAIFAHATSSQRIDGHILFSDSLFSQSGGNMYY